jgi:thermitase
MLAVLVAAPSASAEYVPGQVIVKFDEGTTVAEKTAVLARAGALDRLGHIRGIGAEVVRVAGDAKEIAADLNAFAAVEYAEVDKILTAAAVPNDPLFGDQYALPLTHAPEGWDLAGLGAFPATGGTKVGIIDTGIDPSHPEFSGRISNCAQSTSLLTVSGGIKSGCTDVDGHGTMVAGILGARANNGEGIAGVAFNAPLAICRALNEGIGRGSTSNVANCLGYLRSKGAKVISMSFGGGDTKTLHDAIKKAWGNGYGSVLLAAAGNDGGYGEIYPAGYDEVIAVASTDATDGWGGSNHYVDVELSAPGVDILTTKLGGGYVTGTGTSAATPYAAGVAALMRQQYPGAAAFHIRNGLANTADDLGDPGRDSYYGFGRVNVCRAMLGDC